ncbi:MAG: amidase [Alphaproteobacteria bacterium]|nr:amidase [Alphaproteobacteria bacterium]
MMLSALSLARSIEAGEFSPAHVIDLCADAVAKREHEVGAFVTLDVDRARRDAQIPGLKDNPLRGLPVALKDIFDTADMPTEYGSPIYAGYRPKADASLAALIRRTGGTLFGKTVTTQFAHIDPGKTRNPHNLAHTPGGSSSGSAAGVAAGFFPIATGSQTGGSVIRPASFCGVAGFKPSYRLLPTVGMKCMSWHLDTAGLFAASVADVAFAASVIGSRDLRVDGRTPSSPRIGVLRHQPWPAASDDMIAALDNVARAASAANARVRDIKLAPVLASAFRAHATIQSYEAARSLASEYERSKEMLAKGVLELVETGFTVTADAYDDARSVATQARRALNEAMTDIDVILSPSAPGAAPKGLGSTGSSTFNRLWTLMGTPCVNVPGLADPAGLPLGIQVIGRFGSDRATLEAALFVESLVARRA